MSTELAAREGSTLAMTGEQTYWTDKQIAALQHMGVEHAGEGDLLVFHHVCQRTGLDPFARQIYMIGRESSENVNGEWRKVVKQTIQTGIDGFRLIGRRAADRAKHSVSVSAPEWAHPDGSWRPVWMGEWGQPVAARVTIQRNGEPFTAVALFDEYKQAKRNGDLTRMWAQRPAGQIAKCAEALAWRMAFPQDLSGIYADEEMGQADSASQPATTEDRSGGGLAAALAGRPDSEPEPEKVTAEQVQDAPAPDTQHAEGSVTKAQLTKLHTCLTNVGLSDRDEALAYYRRVTGREVDSSKALTKWEAGQVIDDLERAEKGEHNLLDPASANDPALDLKADQ